MSKTLAIVIPAYRAKFLDITLGSIDSQNCRDFTVYVGDDASPDDLSGLCTQWSGKFDLRYTRFPTNMGSTDLVGHWTRCIALSDQPWIWLFSDDDWMPHDAVVRLLTAVSEEGHRQSLFHFNVDRIDAEGELICHEPQFPPYLSSREFALRRLRFQLSSYAPDYVFSRDAFTGSGGFVPFPRAWCSDDATWILLGARAGIRTLEGQRVQWRSSGDNISSRHRDDAQMKVLAQVEFLRWLDRFLIEHPSGPGDPSDEMILASMPTWFRRQAKFLGVRFIPHTASYVARGLAEVRGMSRLQAWSLILRSDGRRGLLDLRDAARGSRDSAP